MSVQEQYLTEFYDRNTTETSSVLIWTIYVFDLNGMWGWICPGRILKFCLLQAFHVVGITTVNKEREKITFRIHYKHLVRQMLELVIFDLESFNAQPAWAILETCSKHRRAGLLLEFFFRSLLKLRVAYWLPKMDYHCNQDFFEIRHFCSNLCFNLQLMLLYHLCSPSGNGWELRRTAGQNVSLPAK